MTRFTASAGQGEEEAALHRTAHVRSLADEQTPDRLGPGRLTLLQVARLAAVLDRAEQQLAQEPSRFARPHGAAASYLARTPLVAALAVLSVRGQAAEIAAKNPDRGN